MSTEALDALAAAGLYDADAPNAAERRELLEFLLERFSVDDILSVDLTRGPITDVLAVLNNPRVHLLTAVEVAAQTGMTPGEIENLRALLGLPIESLDSAEITDSFIGGVALYQLGVAAYGEARTQGFARVLGALVASLMDAARELSWAGSHDTPMSELDVAIANDTNYAAARLIPDMFGNLFFERAARDIWIEEELRRGPITMGVAFVDLVGSTNWTAQLASEDHAAALNRFEELSVRAAGRHGGRVVKFIGDEAMIVGRDASEIATAAGELCAAIAHDPVLPGARGAVGYGRVTPRGGDYFGDIVNLVARATKEVGGDALVVTPEVAAALDPSHWVLGEPQTLELRGVDAAFVVIAAARVEPSVSPSS